MCNKCEHINVGKQIIELQSRIEKAFAVIDGNPSLVNDLDLIRLIETMESFLEKYNSATTVLNENGKVDVVKGGKVIGKQG